MSSPPTPPCGPLLKCHKGKEDAEVTAGGQKSAPIVLPGKKWDSRSYPKC